MSSSDSVKTRAWAIPALLLMFGVFMFVMSVIYGVFVVGLPYPDQTPAEAQQAAFHGKIAGAMFLMGIGLVLGGFFVLTMNLIASRKRRAIMSIVSKE